MLQKFFAIVGFVWALPVTLIGLAYAGLFSALGWYRHDGFHDGAFFYYVTPAKCPTWLNKLWSNWAGQAIGSVVVIRALNPAQDLITIRHELQHVKQVCRLGIFQPIVYAICLAAIYLGCPDSDPYADCIFEIDARRAAGQTVDLTAYIHWKNGKK